MDHSLPSARAAERILKQAGLDRPAPQTQPERPRGRGRAGRLLRRLRLRAVLLLLCAALAIAAQLLWCTGTASDTIGPPASASDPRFGAVEAFRAPYEATTVGVRWERIHFGWRDLQPTGPDSWNAFATDHDRAIDAELKAGRQLVGLLINTPDWAAAIPAQHGASPPRGLYRAWDDPRNTWGHFVGQIATRYAGRIDHWVIWNEISITAGKWSTWKGSVADYAQLVKVAYLAAKSANPRARIILAGDPYWYDRGAATEELLGRLTASADARAHGGYFDVANLHLYNRPTDIATVVGWYRQALLRQGLAKPIWIAESNAIPYDDSVRRYPRGGFFASTDDQASYIVQAYAIALALGVQRIEVNRMLDGADFAAGGEPFGLVRNDGTARPAFWAYRTVSNLFSQVTGGEYSDDRAFGVRRVVLRRPGATVTVVWDARPIHTVAAIPAIAPNASLYDKFGQARTIRARDGHYAIALEGARGNTNGADATDYVIGGSPLILVQRR